MRDWTFARGLLAVIVGVALAPLSIFSVGIISFAFGIYLVIDAFLIFYAGLADAGDRTVPSRPLEIEGIAAGAFGVFTLIRPLVPILSAPLMIAVWMLVAGSFALYISWRDRTRLLRPGAYLASGLISIIAGGLLFLRPLGGPALLLALSGYLVVTGLLMLLSSGGFSREARKSFAMS